MLVRDYLTLRPVCLKHPDKWANEGLGFCFVFPTGGAGKYFSGTVTSSLSPGDVLVFDAAGEAGISLSTERELVFERFSACFEQLYPLFATHEISLLRNVRDSFKQGKLYAASTPLAAQCHKLIREAPPEFSLDHRGQLLRVVAAILAAELKQAQARRAGYVRIEDHLAQVFEKLSIDELLTLSVGALADKFGCSRRHLNRLFHQHIGLSVAALRMELRMLKAISLLRNPDAKVVNIAQECGFNHLGLFNTCFRKRFGASPSQWRKSSIQAEGPAVGRKGAKHALSQHSRDLRLAVKHPPLGTLAGTPVQIQREDHLNHSASPDRSNRIAQFPIKVLEVFEVMPGIKIRLRS